MHLRITEYKSRSRWRWELNDGTGTFLGDHEVDLDERAEVFRAVYDLPGYLKYHNTEKPHTDAYAEQEGRLMEKAGSWLGDHLLGGMREPLRAALDGTPTAIHVSIPEQARELLGCPLELAWLEGQPLESRAVRFVYGEPCGKAPKLVEHPTLRVLALFSLPTGASPLNLRRERVTLRNYFQQLAATKGLALECEVLQYGVTRHILKDTLRQAPGWDLIHFSGHGATGNFVLEQADGKPDPIHADDMEALLRPSRKRLKLLTLSACWSGAALPPQWLDLMEGTRDGGATEAAEPVNLPGLGESLARALDCAVLAMRYPVTDLFAEGLAHHLYRHLIEGKAELVPALNYAADDALADSRDHGAQPPLNTRYTLMLFGPAAGLRLHAPKQSAAFALPVTGLFHFPPEPERFVGRTLPMLRASQVLAPEHTARGVLFHGMAGAGKTSCALELAYRHRRGRFMGYVWYEAPEEGHDMVGALFAFMQAMESQLGMNPGNIISNIDPPEFFRERLLPALKGMLEENAILMVIDNLEGLLTRSNAWRDARWGDLLKALLTHRGASRLVLTSRRVPAILAKHKGLLREPVHALSLDESLLVARDLDNLQRLADSGRHDLFLRVLTRVQGHPKLLELANGLAADQAALAAYLGEASGGGERPELTAFFQRGESDLEDKGFIEALDAWTGHVFARLDGTAKLVLAALACMEPWDRVQGHLKGVFAAVCERLSQAEDAGEAAEWVEADRDVDAALAGLREQALIEIGAEGDEAEIGLHPAIAESVRALAGEAVARVIDATMTGVWLGVYQHGLDTEMQGGGPMVVLGARRAAPYLMRAQDWEVACKVLEELCDRAKSPAQLAEVLPMLRYIVEQTRDTPEGLKPQFVLAKNLARASRRDEAEALLRDGLLLAEKAGDYRTASNFSGQLVDLLRQAGQYEQALAEAERKIRFSEKAGLGPWTRLADEVCRLQVLNAMGRYREVLEAVKAKREQMVTLPESGEAEEAVLPWNVREAQLDTGREAAHLLNDWSEALALNAVRLEAKQSRGADAHESARTRFNDYFPLLRLGRFDDARALLEGCRTTFETVGDFASLGKTLSALADLEDKLGSFDAAIHFERGALAYKYKAGDPETCACSHHNLANYLQQAGTDPSEVLAHRLAAALIFFATGSGHFVNSSLPALAGMELPETPPTFAAIVAQVETVPGVRFSELYARLPQRYPDGDAALAGLWRQVAKYKAHQSNEKARVDGHRAKLEALDVPEDVKRALLAGDLDKAASLMEAQLEAEQQRVQALIQAAFD